LPYFIPTYYDSCLHRLLKAGLQRECGQSFKLEDPIREGPVRLDVAGLEKGNNVTSSQIPLFREFVVLELRFVCNLLWTR
jgi:hypothetical protein